MKKFATLGGVGGIVGLALVAALATQGSAADRHVSPALVADPMADITDVYAWMQSSQILNLVMDVSPAEDGSHSFGPGLTYVFHLTSKADPDVPAAVDVETRLLCQFASGTSVQCWATDPSSAATPKGYKAYLKGDPSGAAGVQTADRKLKVFAGRRADPLFFNATGLTAAVAQYNALAVGKPNDPAGCPTWLTGAQADSLLTALRTGGDPFATTNVMAIVVQIDTSLVHAGTNKTVAVWGATHAAP